MTKHRQLTLGLLAEPMLVWRLVNAFALRVALVLVLAFIYVTASTGGLTQHLPISVKKLLVWTFGI